MSGTGPPKRTVLVIDDDELFCDAASHYLQEEGRAVESCHTAAAGLAAVAAGRVDVVLLDQNLPDAEGHSLCPKILAANERCKIIFITAQPTFEGAVKAIRVGAVDYLSKPFEPEELALTVERELRTLDLEDVAVVARYRSQKEGQAAVLVGAEGGLASAASLVALAAGADAPVLLSGETGTGKNVAAKVIHFTSARQEGPFITLNCAALPENLIEAELFGHVKGAFTGASGMRRGVFEMAQGGTLFLDEIGEMPLHLQAKLLSVLEDHEVRRLGGESTVPVDVRVIAATGAPLDDRPQRTFRQDLYFRLSVMRIHMPPLRERRMDIPALCDHFLQEIVGRDRPAIAEGDLERLMAYDWPGNVRELRNVLERATILQRGPTIQPSVLLGGSVREGEVRTISVDSGRVRILPMKEAERRHLLGALEVMGYNYTRTADALGIALSTLKRKVKRYGIQRPGAGGNGGPGGPPPQPETHTERGGWSAEGGSKNAVRPIS